MVCQDLPGVRNSTKNINMNNSPTNGGPETPDFLNLLEFVDKNRDKLMQLKKINRGEFDETNQIKEQKHEPTS